MSAQLSVSDVSAVAGRVTVRPVGAGNALNDGAAAPSAPVSATLLNDPTASFLSFFAVVPRPSSVDELIAIVCVLIVLQTTPSADDCIVNVLAERVTRTYEPTPPPAEMV